MVDEDLSFQAYDTLRLAAGAQQWRIVEAIWGNAPDDQKREVLASLHAKIEEAKIKAKYNTPDSPVVPW